MASNGVKSEKLNFRLPFVAHERPCLSSVLMKNLRCRNPNTLKSTTNLEASSNLPSCLSFRSCSLSFSSLACRSLSDSDAHSAAPTCFIRASVSSLSFSASYFCSKASTRSCSADFSALERACVLFRPRTHAAKLSYQRSWQAIVWTL